MTYEDVTAFLCVAQYNNFTKASELLYITQPTISRRIQNLEKELGYPLIVRQKGGRNVELTEEGQTFLAYAEQWKKLYQDIGQIPHRSKYIVFNVSGQTRMMQHIFPSVCIKFISKYPDVHLNLTNLPSSVSYERMSQGTVDLAFVTIAKHQKNIKTVPTFEEDYLFACNSRSEYPDTVSPSDLKPEKAVILTHAPETDPWYDYWFGRSSNSLVLLDDTALMASILASGDYWTIIPASVAHSWRENPDITFRTLLNSPPPRTTYHLQSSYTNTKLCDEFLSILKEVLTEFPHVHSF